MSSKVENSCGNCGETESQLKTGRSLRLCSRCKSVKYCSRQCQRADFKSHRKPCKPHEKDMVNNLSNGLPALIRHTPSTAEDPIAYFFSTLSDEELNTPTTVIDSMQRETAPQQEMVLRDVQNHFMHPAVVKTETMLFVPSIATTYVPGGYREELLRVKARLEEGSPATNFEIMLHSTIAQYAVTQSSGRQDYHTVTLVCQGQALYCVRQRLQGRESDDGEDGWKNTDLGEVKQGEALNMPCSAEWMMSSIPEDMKATLLLVASFV